VFLRDTEEPVKVLNCDERRGIGVFTVNKPLPAIPESLMTGSLRPGDTLIPFRLSHEVPDDAYRVTAVDQIFCHETATGQMVRVEHAVRLDRNLQGSPCQCLLKDGKLAAICLDNFPDPSTDRLEGYCLPIEVARLAFADWRAADGAARPVPSARTARPDARPREAGPASPSSR
jgi:hypothetical protein